MFLQESVPDTSQYMILGYTVSFLVIGLYVLSLYIRNRNLKRDITLLEDMDKAAPADRQPKVSSDPQVVKPYGTVTKKSTKS